jgi:hypothetical protein
VLHEHSEKQNAELKAHQQSEVAELHQHSEKQVAELESAQAACSTAESALHELEGEISSMESEHALRLGEEQGRVLELEQQISTLEEEHSTFTATSRAMVDRAEKKNDEVLDKKEELQAQVAAKEAALEQLSVQLHELEGTFTRIESEHAEALGEEQSHVVELHVEMRMLKAQGDAAAASATEVHAEATKEKMQLEAQLEQSCEAVADLEEAAGEQQRKLVAEQEQVKHLEEVVSGLQKQVAAAVVRQEGLKHEAQQAIVESLAWESKYAVVVADGQQRVEKLVSELAAIETAQLSSLKEEHGRVEQLKSEVAELHEHSERSCSWQLRGRQ